MRVQHKENGSFYQRALRWALAFPLFYKLLVANAALAVAAAMVGSWAGGLRAAGSQGPWFRLWLD